MPSIADLLNAARRRSFVGREHEIDLFERFLQSDPPEYVLLYLYGTGGQGKTTLARYLADSCTERHIGVLSIDAREIEPQPNIFLENVRWAAQKLLPEGSTDRADTFDLLRQLPGKTVLFIDTYEKMAPLDNWIRVEFLPNLPARILTVIGSRNAPALTWMTDPGWRALMKTLQLRNFSPVESAEYLHRRHIPEDKIRPIIEFTHGHPLALSVVADIYEKYPEKNFHPDESPDVVRTLLQLFVQQVPSPMHRAALEVCALVNILTESLLAEVMGLEDAGELFNWLCSLSFISIGRDGIYPHDITREALTADVRWRHPDWNATLHNRSRQYYHRKLKETAGDAQRRVLFDLLYLHRTNAVVRPFFDWQEAGSFWVDTALDGDLPVLRDMVFRHEGESGRDAFDFWSTHPAAQIWVWRDGIRQANAFLLKIFSHDLSPGDPAIAAHDPAVTRVLGYQHRHLHLRQGEQAALFRFWMSKETYQGVSALQSSIFLTIVQHYFLPGLATSMVIAAHPEFWKPGFAYGDIHHVPELDFEAGGMPFGWFVHDWRARPPLAWLDLLGKRETDAAAGAGEELDAPALRAIVLSEAEFAEGVADALRHFHNNNQLLQNPLIHSKLVVQESGAEATDGQRVGILKDKVLALMKEIEASPIDGKFHRVLYRTFINPVGSQEKTADFLNMSFSTYRRYLQAGVQRVTELLWSLEIG